MTEMNLRLSRKLVALVKHICSSGRENFRFDELLSTGAGGECYPLCDYLIQKKFAWDRTNGITVPRELQDALLCHAEDLVSYFEKCENDRNLANQEKIDNIKYGKKAYDLAENTAKWNKRSIIFTGIVATTQIIQWIILIIQWLSTP